MTVHFSWSTRFYAGGCHPPLHQKEHQGQIMLAVADRLPSGLAVFYAIIGIGFIAWFIFALPRGRSSELFSYIERRHGGFKAWMFFIVLIAVAIGLRFFAGWLL
jgi:hypothetical protein